MASKTKQSQISEGVRISRLPEGGYVITAVLPFGGLSDVVAFSSIQGVTDWLQEAAGSNDTGFEVLV